jgi:hypothetical protein
VPTTDVVGHGSWSWMHIQQQVNVFGLHTTEAVLILSLVLLLLFLSKLLHHCNTEMLYKVVEVE